MNFLVLSVCFSVFVFTLAAKPRSVNLALETVLEFDKANDVDIINQMQQFLNKIKDIISDDPEHKDVPTRRSQRYQFTDFLEDVVLTLKSFKSDDLKKVLQIMTSEIQTRKVDEDKLQKNIRRFLSDTLQNITVRSPKKIRNSLDDVLRKLNNNKQDKDSYLMGFINSLYKKDSEAKLAKFISRLKIFRRSSVKNNKLQDAIGKALKTIIFDHISNLPKITKRKIEAWINGYLRENENVRVNNLQKSIEKDSWSESIDKESSLEKGALGDEETVDNNLKNISSKKQKNNVSRNKKKRYHNKMFTMKTKKNDFELHTTKKLTHITLYPKSIEVEKRPIKTRYRVAHSAVSVKESQEEKDISSVESNENSAVKVTSLSHSVEINVDFLKNKEHGHTFRNMISIPTENRDLRFITRDGNKINTLHSILESKKLYHSTTKRINKKPVKYFGNLRNSSMYDNIRKEYKILKESQSNINKNNLIKKYANKGHGILKDRRNYKPNKPSNMPKITKNKASNRRANELSVMNEKEKYNSTDKITNSINITNNISTSHVQNISNFKSSIKNTPIETPTNETVYSTNVTILSDRILEANLNEISNDVTDLDLKQKFKTNLTKLQSYASRGLIKDAEVTETVTEIETVGNKILKGQNTETTTRNVTQTVPIDVKNLIKNYEIQDIQDVEKKNEIERKVKEDLKNLLSPSMTPSVTDTTTEAFTDIFKDLEEEFQLS